MFGMSDLSLLSVNEVSVTRCVVEGRSISLKSIRSPNIGGRRCCCSSLG